jgi:PTH1 family peptidyl-tRNA hydrolase
MKMIVGLGNPGPKYETTRHNVGFLLIDRLIDRWNASGPMTKNQGEVYQTSFRGEKIQLIKPQTYMNRSGQCVGPLFSFYHCQPEDLIVIHDELALPALTFRLKTGGGAGGHNGIKSLDEHLGKEQVGYHRIRIGIGHPSQIPALARMSPADYVLQPFRNEELSSLDSLFDDAASAIEMILSGQIQAAMNQYHRSKPELK